MQASGRSTPTRTHDMRTAPRSDVLVSKRRAGNLPVVCRSCDIATKIARNHDESTVEGVSRPFQSLLTVWSVGVARLPPTTDPIVSVVWLALALVPRWMKPLLERRQTRPERQARVCQPHHDRSRRVQCCPAWARSLSRRFQHQFESRFLLILEWTRARSPCLALGSSRVHRRELIRSWSRRHSCLHRSCTLRREPHRRARQRHRYAQAVRRRN